MIVIPEKGLIVITPPRTGSAALTTAVLRRWKNAKVLYSHMESVGVPKEYAHYDQICVIRNPFDRMWSLYKYMAITHSSPPQWREAMRREAARPFEEWLLEPYERFVTNDGMNPDKYRVIYDVPEPLKSQALYAGDAIVAKMEGNMIDHWLDIEREPENGTDDTPMPTLSYGARMKLRRRWAWDLQFYKEKQL